MLPAATSVEPSAGIGLSRGAAAAVTVPVATAALLAAWWGVNFDVRYVLGGLRAAEGGGAGSFASVFVHRPLAYRALAAGLDALPSRLPGPTGAVAEVVLRGEALLLVAAASMLLLLGIRRHRPGPVGPVVAGAVGAAQALAPDWTFLEPDWVGVLVAVAGAGAALWPRRAAVAGMTGGALLVLAAVVKITTAPYVLIALGVVALLDRRRALVVAVWASGIGLGWLLATWQWQPVEWQWLEDMTALNGGSPLRVGLGGVDWPGFARSLANAAVVSPVVVAIPAATALRARSGSPTRVVAAVAAAVTLTVVPVLLQAQWFLYQWVALPVLAAGLVAAALTLDRRPGAVVAVLGPTAAAGALSAVALVQPLQSRAGHLAEVAGVLLLLAAVGVVLALRPPRGPSPRVAVALTLVATLLGFGAANLPDAGFSLTGYSAEITTTSLRQQTVERRVEFATARNRIGPDTPVLYLAFGDVGYLLGNPTPCRYPSPVWLQRSTYLPGLTGLASYLDNARCLDDPGPQWLVWQRSWFDLSRLDTGLTQRIAVDYDCRPGIALTVPAAATVLCPRR